MAAAAGVQLFASRMNALFFPSMISFSHMLHSPFNRHWNRPGKEILDFKCSKNNRYLLPNPVICSHTRLLRWLSPWLPFRWCWWCNYLTCLSDMDWTFAGCWWEGLFSGLYFWKGIASHPSWQTQTIRERMSALLWDLSNTQPHCVSPLGLLWSAAKHPGVPSYWNSTHFQYLAGKLGITPNSCWKLLIPITAIRKKALSTQVKVDLDLSLFSHQALSSRKQFQTMQVDDLHVMPLQYSVSEIPKDISWC